MFETQHKKVALLLDIGNGSVAVALALIAKDSKSSAVLPEIIRYVREPLAFDERPTGEQLQASLIAKLDQAFALLSKQEKALTGRTTQSNVRIKDATSILCTLSSPWFFSKGKTVAISEQKAFIMSERFIADVLSKEIEVFKEEIGQADDLVIVEKAVIGATVNGYAVQQPLNQKTDTCEIYTYMSAANKVLLDKIRSVIGTHSHLSHEYVLFHTFPLVTFSVIRDSFPTAHEYLLFDIAGEITDIAWVSHGMIKKTVSYPCGTHLPLRQLAKHFDVPYEVARSYFRLFVDGRAEKAVAEEIRRILIDTGKEFNIYLEEALKTLSPTLVLPYRIFVCTYPHALDIFSQFVKQDIPDDIASWRAAMSMTYLGSDMFKTEDAFLGLEAAFLSKFI